MLTILVGTDWVANRDAVLSLVAQDVHDCKENTILLVPELISHDMERRLCIAAGDTASRYAEVLSFSRLVRRVSESTGCAVDRCMDAGGRVVAMAAAVRQLHSKLKAYASVETRPEFLTGLVDAVDEFKRCCITSTDLLNASRNTSGAFAQKLEELSLILEAYDAVTARGLCDPRDQMSWLADRIADSDFAQKHRFYIDGFPDFTRQHMALLEQFICNSDHVTISINCDAPGSGKLSFEKAGATANELVQLAKQHNIACSVRTVMPVSTPVDAVKASLFQGPLQRSASTDNDLLVYRCTSADDECNLAVERILSLVQSGCRYRDIAVVCSDMTTYRNKLAYLCSRCGIPAYISGTEGILDKTVIGTVISAVEAALSGFERTDVLRYLKSVLSPLDMDTCDLLENYAILWGINGNRWLQTWENHPDGLGEEWTDRAKQKLADLNAARETAMLPLATLRKSFREATDLKQQVYALCAFFEDIQLSNRLDQLAAHLDKTGNNREAQILDQLWEILLGALEQLHDVLGDSVWEAETFVRLFILLLSQYDVGTIPPVLDSVMIGSVSAMRCQQVKHLIVLGVHEGTLPGYCGSSGVLTDQERDALRHMGVTLTGGSMEGLQAEFSEIYGVFCGARNTITVTSGSGQPSFIYRRLATLSGAEKEPEGVLVSAIANPVAAAAYLVRNRAGEVAQSLGISAVYNDIHARSQYALGCVQPVNTQALYGQSLRLSASQVDRQAECRFSYFLKYGMRAKERKEATVDPAEFGTYVHAVLEKTAAKVMELGGFHVVSLDKTMELALSYADAYAKDRFSQLDSQRMVYLFRRNVQELQMVVRELWDELKDSAFEPIDFELGFGDGMQMPPIEITGTNMQAQLRGFVDRVDAWRNGDSQYFRVVDYKTGRKDFDYCDVFNGIGLQMLLYLFALEQGGESVLGDNRIPAGVQYFPARSPLISASGRLSDTDANAERLKCWKRKGLLLSDTDVIAAMEPEGTPKRLSCKLSKDGELSGDIADRDQLAMLRAYVFGLLSKMVDEIASGNIEPNPYTRGSSHNACTFCPYKSICHADDVQGRRNYKSMNAQRFWDEIGKEMKNHG